MSQATSTDIETIFRRPISREINKVVKVEQEDAKVVGSRDSSVLGRVTS